MYSTYHINDFYMLVNFDKKIKIYIFRYPFIVKMLKFSLVNYCSGFSERNNEK